jgi:hypothetical protein
MSQNTAQLTSTSSKEAIAVPDGFVLVKFEDGLQCIVPEFLVPATNEAFDGYRSRLAMDVGTTLGGVSVVL